MKASKITATVIISLILSLLTTLSGCAGQGENGPAGGSAEAWYNFQPADKSVDIKHQTPAPEDFPVPGPGPEPPAMEPEKQPRNTKVAYLTFDDGPNSHYTERILDILQSKKVKATFFVVGENVLLNPGVLQRTLAGGHGVANHTFSHDYNAIYKSPEAFLADLDKNNQIIMKYTGRPAMLFRAPGGPDKLDKHFAAKLKERGYISVGWNITAMDSDPRGTTSTQVYNNILSGLEKVERLNLTPIILMHDGTQLATAEARPGSPLAAYIQNREATAGALPEVIDLFKSRGYTFVVVDENTPRPW